MDPYLEDEALWPVFHHHLISCLYQVLLPGLVDRYRARVGERHYDPGDHAERHEEFIEIRQRSDGRLVTLLDIASPANKTTPGGRQAYLSKRAEAQSDNANLVEIDLVLQGQPLLDYSREGLPDWNYSVTVTRASQPERHEIYTSTLQKKLPRFRLPLAAEDRDTVLDLHEAFRRCYDQANLGAKIDYQRDPATVMSDENRTWLAQYLKHQKLRKEARQTGGVDPPHEAIALAAYYLWLAEGRTHGRDREHWLRALEQLRGSAGG
jgi:hypothetical protein